MTHVVRETSVWGSGPSRLRNLKKREILVSCRPYIDHPRIYAYKPCRQRGRARESQTFLISFAYSRSVDDNNEDNEDDFLRLVDDSGLLVCRYRTTFRGTPAYKIVVADRDVNVLHALELLGPDTEETSVAALPKWSILERLFHDPNALGRNRSEEQQQGIQIAPQTYQCPHCSWINVHNGEAGHRECDGPVQSQCVCAPCAPSRWTGVRLNNEWRMYYCPGYTI